MAEIDAVPTEDIVPPLCAVVDVTSSIISVVVSVGAVLGVAAVFLQPVSNIKVENDINRIANSRGVFMYQYLCKSNLNSFKA